MDSESSLNKRQFEDKIYMEAEAKKVHLYIGELRTRLAQLQTEGDEIERTTENILGDEPPSFYDGDEDMIENPSTSEAADVGVSSFSIGPIISEATGFTSLLRKFENMKNEQPVKTREESEEILQLREQNGNIREKIKQIQSRIERAQMMKSSISRDPSKETFEENETCTQLYEATTNTLRKVDEIEEDIKSVESIFMERTKSHAAKIIRIRRLK